MSGIVTSPEVEVLMQAVLPSPTWHSIGSVFVTMKVISTPSFVFSVNMSPIESFSGSISMILFLENQFHVGVFRYFSFVPYGT